jgi:hypothetical protein
VAKDDKTTGMKSAYDLALERLERQGIEKPREEALSPEARLKIADLRNQCEAKLAELEILHRDNLARIEDSSDRAKAEEEYAAERRRVEARCERDIERLRAQV